MKLPRLHVYRDRKRAWRWRLVLPNGRTVADSAEGYTRRFDAIRAVRALKVAAARAVIKVDE